MKLTKKQVSLFKETHNKWLDEGNFLANLFVKKVKKSIENSDDIEKAVKDADKSLETARKKIQDKLNNDKNLVKKTIPSDVRKYLGFDY